MVDNPADESLGARIRELRFRRGWTQRELAVRAGVSHAYINRLEKGLHPHPSVEKVSAIASAFGLTLNQVLEGISPYDVLPATAQWSPTVTLPIARPTVSAGRGGFLPTGENVEVPAELVLGKRVVAVRVDGDCLAPEILPGDIVIVEMANRQPQDGQIVVVLTPESELLVKRYRVRDGRGVLVDARGVEYQPNGAVIQGVVIFLTRSLV